MEFHQSDSPGITAKTLTYIALPHSGLTVFTFLPLHPPLFTDLDSKISVLNKENRELLIQLETFKSQEREVQQQLDEDKRDIEKIANKQSIYLKNVSCDLLFSMLYNGVYIFYLILILYIIIIYIIRKELLFNSFIFTDLHNISAKYFQH